MACQTALAVGAFILCLALWAGNGMVKIFAGANPELQQLAGAGLKLYATSFVLSGFNIIAAAYFTSVGAAGRAATVSILRSLVWVSLLLWILPGWLGNAGIWLTVPLTELLTFFMAYPWVRRSGAILRSGWEGEYSV
ncbi:hypothetical protein EDC14_104232 [Hydrogenispora ethanolica]|uniref:MatE protein n=1 Tax=Hydrogenispora ethanolica TaxID=1082276 RepID=A0A4R1QZD1_HYDET|nr:hypothetical protein [Hydrogenispora ethanolica]TCL58339.1 hypothetical protein EDC14_104232 [Hydrogenispora ethanolica]